MDDTPPSMSLEANDTDCPRWSHYEGWCNFPHQCDLDTVGYREPDCDRDTCDGQHTPPADLCAHGNVPNVNCRTCHPPAEEWEHVADDIWDELPPEIKYDRVLVGDGENYPSWLIRVAKWVAENAADRRTGDRPADPWKGVRAWDPNPAKARKEQP